MIKNFEYTERKTKFKLFVFFLIGVSYPNDTDLLYVGTNIIVRSKKKWLMKKLRVEKVQLNCLFMRKKGRRWKSGNTKQTHKSITTAPALNFDVMSSDDSKDKWNNATTKSGGQGYLSEDDYQSRRKSSQGKWDHSQVDERRDKVRTEKRMWELEDKLYVLEENNKGWRQNLRQEIKQ